MSGTITMTGEEYDALRAEAEAMRVVLHEIASVNPAERGIEWAKSYASDSLKGAGSELYARWLDTFKEAEALRAQVSALQSDANSWQSGYDKGREDGAKSAEGWKSQHARDSAELRKLCAERDAISAELKRWERSHREVHEPALREAHAYIQELRAELEEARGLLREVRQRCQLPDWARSQIDKLTATTAPEVPDHTERNLEMVEQGERQEAVAWTVAYPPEYKPFMHHLSFGSESEAARYAQQKTPKAMGCVVVALYTTPQPGPDVRALVEALEECAASLAWNCFGECRAIHAGPIMPAAMALDTARAALAIHRQAQQGGSHDT